MALPKGSKGGRGSKPNVALRSPDEQPAKRRKVAAAPAELPAAAAPRQWEWQVLGGPAAAALCRAFTGFVG